jgi:hypothetical protein
VLTKPNNSNTNTQDVLREINKTKLPCDVLLLHMAWGQKQACNYALYRPVVRYRTLVIIHMQILEYGLKTGQSRCV